MKRVTFRHSKLWAHMDFRLKAIWKQLPSTTTTTAAAVVKAPSKNFFARATTETPYILNNNKNTYSINTIDYRNKHLHTFEIGAGTKKHIIWIALCHPLSKVFPNANDRRATGLGQLSFGHYTDKTTCCKTMARAISAQQSTQEIAHIMLHKIFLLHPTDCGTTEGRWNGNGEGNVRLFIGL